MSVQYVYSMTTLAARPQHAGLLTSVSLVFPLLLLLLVAIVIVIAWKRRTRHRENGTYTAHKSDVGFVNPLYTGSDLRKPQHHRCENSTIVRGFGYNSTKYVANKSAVELWPRRQQKQSCYADNAKKKFDYA